MVLVVHTTGESTKKNKIQDILLDICPEVVKTTMDKKKTKGLRLQVK